MDARRATHDGDVADPAFGDHGGDDSILHHSGNIHDRHVMLAVILNDDPGQGIEVFLCDRTMQELSQSLPQTRLPCG
ncbi:MAG: hypothetical protein KA004_11760 [Verrucomicrobiales bacterium]|nr:hypothetical protein [Verrucomicrobiales bacterium]